MDVEHNFNMCMHKDYYALRDEGQGCSLCMQAVDHTLKNIGQGWILGRLSMESVILRGMKKMSVFCELFSLPHLEGQITGV